MGKVSQAVGQSATFLVLTTNGPVAKNGLMEGINMSINVNHYWSINGLQFWFLVTYLINLRTG